MTGAAPQDNVGRVNRFRIPLLESITDLACLFTGRGDEPRPDPARLLPMLGEGDGTPQRLAILRQIHSNRCLMVRVSDLPQVHGAHVAGEGDALVTGDHGLALGVATADCLPLLAVDPKAGVLAVAHAGWRGTMAGVLESTLAIMRGSFGADPARIVIGAGPAAGACCYEVGPEVRESFARARPAQSREIFGETTNGKARLDLFAANRLQAIAAGVPAGQIVSAGICTICRPELTHSYRRDGQAAGRMWVLGALAPRGAATRPSF